MRYNKRKQDKLSYFFSLEENVIGLKKISTAFMNVELKFTLHVDNNGKLLPRK